MTTLPRAPTLRHPRAVTSPGPRQRHRLGTAVAQARGALGWKQVQLATAAVVSVKSVSNVERGIKVDLGTIRKIDAALAAKLDDWQQGRAEHVLASTSDVSIGLDSPQRDQVHERGEKTVESIGGVEHAFAAMLLATLQDEGYTAYRKARSALRERLGPDLLAEVDRHFIALADADDDEDLPRGT